jgi:hypothetical protein
MINTLYKRDFTMSIICKTTSIRPTIQDLYWFEAIVNVNEYNPLGLMFKEFIDQSTDSVGPNLDYVITEKNLHELRPDIIELVNSQNQKDTLIDILAYDPFSISVEGTMFFNSLEEFRQADQVLFDSLNGELDKWLIKTNNKFIQKVYDEAGNFLENGLSNKE